MSSPSKRVDRKTDERFQTRWLRCSLSCFDRHSWVARDSCSAAGMSAEEMEKGPVKSGAREAVWEQVPEREQPSMQR